MSPGEYNGDDMAEKVKNTKSPKYLRDRDRELVKGIFKYDELPGGQLEFVYRKHRGDKIERYKFEDGKVYTIPRGVARHINNNCYYAQHGHILDENGQPSIAVKKKVDRVSFASLEFADFDDLDEPSPIQEVTLDTSIV